jgi:SAM-dependent methyltransferase
LRLPFADACFDLVVCAEVLEHIPAHDLALVEIARVLRPGGDLVVSVPRRGPERLCWAFSAEYAGADGGHVRIYRKPDLIAMLAGAGLKPRAAHYAHSLHTPYWWLKCLVGPRREDVRWVNLYQRFLNWDMFKKPPLTQLLERLLNPILGKSLVVYCKKLPASPWPRAPFRHPATGLLSVSTGDHLQDAEAVDEAVLLEPP